MAVTKIWGVYGSEKHENISRSIKYAANDAKTVDKKALTIEDSIYDGTSSDYIVSSMNNAYNYVTRDDKTAVKRYVSGINCNGENAIEQMTILKKVHGKSTEDGLLLYHAVQSFSPGEIEPDLAHNIGLELAQEMWGKDGYQVLVATHLDRDHIHNHFIVNTVSLSGVTNPSIFHKKLSSISDRLVKENNLSVITDRGANPSIVKLSRRQLRAKNDVDAALEGARDLYDWIHKMNDAGYEVDVNLNHQYWTIKHETWSRPIRIIRFGEDYTNAAVLERIENKDTLLSKAEYLTPKEKYQYEQQRKRIIRNWKNTYQYKYFIFMYQLGIDIRKYQFKRVKMPPKVLQQHRNAARKISYLAQNGIHSTQELKESITIQNHHLLALKAKRNDIVNQIRKARRHGESSIQLQKYLDDINKEIEYSRTELKICNELLEENGYISYQSEPEPEPEPKKNKEKERGVSI